MNLKWNKMNNGYRSEDGAYFIHKGKGDWTAYRNGKSITVSTLKNAKQICQNHASGSDKLVFG